MNFFTSMKEAKELVASVTKENEALKAQLEAMADKIAKAEEMESTIAGLEGVVASEKAAREEVSKEIESLKADRDVAASEIAGLQAENSAYKHEIDMLKADAKTSEVRARELLANMGGKPLADDASEAASELDKMSQEELIKASYNAKGEELVKIQKALKTLKSKK